MVDNTLTELCQELHNWFDRVRYIGQITLDANGGIFCDGKSVTVLEGQYFRITDSVFADGVHLYPDVGTTPESFNGAVWVMAVPPAVKTLAMDISAWREKYENVNAPSMSPYMSESFGGYSYQKGSAFTSNNNSGGASWKTTFAARMNPWRKI